MFNIFIMCCNQSNQTEMWGKTHLKINNLSCEEGAEDHR